MTNDPLALPFDTIIMVDWSGGNDRGARPCKDAIWACIAQDGIVAEPVYLRNRQVAESWLVEVISAALNEGRRICAGFDFCFAYPKGFARKLIGRDDPLALWDWFEARVTDSPLTNNRFDLAGQINAEFPGIGPFWGNGLPNRDIDHLPRKGLARHGHDMVERRRVESLAKGSFSCWQLSGAGAVGSQVIMGLPVLSRLRKRFARQTAVWPWEAVNRQLVLSEIWPSLIDETVRDATGPGNIRDAVQMRLMAGTCARFLREDWRAMLDVPAESEGWILGIGHEEAMRRAAREVTICA